VWILLKAIFPRIIKRNDGDCPTGIPAKRRRPIAQARRDKSFEAITEQLGLSYLSPPRATLVSYAAGALRTGVNSQSLVIDTRKVAR
jgi:hypothetical protein